MLGGLAGIGSAGLGLAAARPAEATEYSDSVIAQGFLSKKLSTSGSPTKVAISYGGPSGDPHGSIELGTPGGEAGSPPVQTPFIDFHFAPAGGWGGVSHSNDYNARLQNDADGRLVAKFSGGGQLQVTNGNVSSFPVAGGSAHVRNGGFIAAPDLTVTTQRPLEWGGVVPDGLGEASWTPINLQCDYRRTAADPIFSSGFTGGYHGIRSAITYGTSSVVGKGTIHAYTASVTVKNCSDPQSEQACFVGFHRYDNRNSNAGRAWMTDLNMHGAIGAQQGQLDGIVMFMNNYYAGSPADSESAHVWVVTKQGEGGGIDRTDPDGHWVKTTYAVDNGIAIAGSSGATGAAQGFKVGLRVGGGGGPWHVNASRIGTGIVVRDYDTNGINFAARYAGTTAPAIRVPAGAGEILARGGLVTKTRSGPPGSSDLENEPTVGGHLIVDTTSNANKGRLYVRVGSTWRYVDLK